MTKKKTKKKKDTSLTAAQSAKGAAQIIKTQKEAAAYVGRDTRTIRRWVANGMPITAEGHYIKTMLDMFKVSEGDQSEDRQRHQKADADLKETKAKLAEMELELRTGEWLGREQVERDSVRKITTVKRALLGLGRKISPQLAALRQPRKIQKIIDDTVREIIENFAKS